MHGLLRTSKFELVDSGTKKNGDGFSTFSFESTPESLKIWDHAFKAILRIEGERGGGGPKKQAD